MAFCYLPVDRDQQFLLPPDMREWLDPSHLVWFVLDVVARVDTSVLHARHRRDGVGRRAFDPDMLLALLIYAYCTGQRSSRQIERLCEVDVAYRVVCANLAPDHSTIARFRQDHELVAVQLFTDVLVLCAEAGLATVGVVAVDGTKMAANASLRSNRTRDQIEAEVRQMMGEAAAVDAEQDRLFGERRGDELPEELADPRRRGARLDAALRALETRRRARDQAEAAAQADHDAKAAAAEANDYSPTGRTPRGADPVARTEASMARAIARNERRRAAAGAAGQPLPGLSLTKYRRSIDRARQRAAQQRLPAPAKAETERINVVDPDSRIMKTPHGWAQAYNAQAAVNDRGVVVAATVTQDVGDVAQLVPMMAATRANLDAAGVTDPIGTMLFDAGYCSEANLTAAGPDRLVATAKSWKLRRQARERGWAVGEPPDGATAVQAMEHRLRTKDGAALYSLRQHTIEPVFGDIKANRGFRRFLRRGITAVDVEWQLICATKNIAKMFHAGVVLPSTT
jgi:transposase